MIIIFAMGKTNKHLECAFLVQLCQQQELLYYAWHGIPIILDSSIPSVEEYEHLFRKSEVLCPLTVNWQVLTESEDELFSYLNEIIYVIQEQMIFWRLDENVKYHVIYINMDNYVRLLNDFRSWKFGGIQKK